MKQQGQIAIITLFSLAVFVVIGGSIVTQIVFEQKKAVLEEKSRQAYYAAESGIENALQGIINNTEINENFDIGEAAVIVDAVPEGASESYVVPTQLYPGESFYLNLNDYLGESLTICWDKNSTGIVATYFYRNGTGVMESNTYAANSLLVNNFIEITNADLATTIDNGCGLSGTVNAYDLILPIGDPAYLLVWVAYQDSVQLGFAAEAGQQLPAQNTIITSTAKVSENNDSLTRELKYSVSQVGADAINYPPVWLTVPVYAEGGVTYATE